MKIIITGVTGMVGEGVLLECLGDVHVEAVLCVTRKSFTYTHPKLKVYVVPQFMDLKTDDTHLSGYDACFFCAGVSSIGMKEAAYARITYDMTVHFAEVVLNQNPQMTFIYVSGTGTDSTETGKSMWARVKGKTENKLASMPFRGVYNFRPGFMKATKGQNNTLALYKFFSWTYPLLRILFPDKVSTLKQVAQAMIKVVTTGYPKHTIEVTDIKALAAQ